MIYVIKYLQILYLFINSQPTAKKTLLFLIKNIMYTSHYLIPQSKKFEKLS